ncbi:MAG: hypothetical protein AAF387_21490 [Pseudomonadota bacterium]
MTLCSRAPILGEKSLENASYMPLKPVDWSVIVLGSWNRAILTPAGIGLRILEVPEGTPLEVLIAVDAIAPPKVSHDDTIITAHSSRLTVEPKDLYYPNLDKARGLASKALNALPETPVRAVGVNVNYVIEDEECAVSDEIFSKELDNRLSDIALEIKNWDFGRTISWEDGLVNISESLDENGEHHVNFNFERKSNNQADLLEWLKIPISNVEQFVKSYFENILEIPFTDKRHE